MSIRRVLASWAAIAPLLVVALAAPPAKAATAEAQWGPPVRTATDVQPAQSISTADGTIYTFARDTPDVELHELPHA